MMAQRRVTDRAERLQNAPVSTHAERTAALVALVGPLQWDRSIRRIESVDWRYLVITPSWRGRGQLSWGAVEAWGSTIENATTALYEKLTAPDAQIVRSVHRPPQIVIDAAVN